MKDSTVIPLSSPLVTVAACALVNAQRQVFVQQRPAGKFMSGLWEFPGGKLEPRESPAAALARELQEEIGIIIAAEALTSLTFITHRLDGKPHHPHDLLLLLYGCDKWQGTPVSNEAQAIDWVAPDMLTSLDMPPADEPLLPHIQHYIACLPDVTSACRQP